MKSWSVEFFEPQFQRQAAERDFALNPFERAILPFLGGEVLDLGCGLGNLAAAAASKGHRVTAVDASPTAISQLKRRAVEENLPVTALETNLRKMEVRGEFDSVVAIGLLMFFPQAEARDALAKIKGLARPGGLATVNVLIEGTTFMDMFDPGGLLLVSGDRVAGSIRGLGN